MWVYQVKFCFLKTLCKIQCIFHHGMTLAFKCFSVGQESAMLTIDSDRNICAHCCSNDIGNLATVDKQSSSCHCSAPNSCTAAINDHNIVLIQVINDFHGVGICSQTAENDVCTFADCIFTYLHMDSLWWICQRWKLSQYSCHHT